MHTDPLFIAQGSTDLFFLPQMASRHGLIAGATGTGKTVTLRALAENLSAIGVPVFLADVKGDLSGIAKPGANSPRIKERAAQMGLEIAPNGFPVAYWDVFGKSGNPARATISEMGPLLLSRLLNLNNTQEGVLNIVFHIADDEGMLLIDLKDLQSMLQYVAQNAADYTTKFGNVTSASVGTIQRALLTLEREGGSAFFGEPALDLNDLLHIGADGRGVINILAADKLMTSPRTYSAFLLWMLSELFEQLPEVGDLDKPKLVFFFDEAHLLFNDISQAMQEKIEQVVRLIRSKAVGIYFITQNPLDIPDKVLGQLGNRFQHALRAFTPRDQKAVKSAAETFRSNPKLNVEEVITQLGVGEALVSMLDAKGIPGIVERAFIAPPVSQLDPITAEERSILIEGSELFEKYAKVVDRESAFEMLRGTPAAATPAKAVAAAPGAPYDAVAAARARAAARQTPTTSPELSEATEPAPETDPEGDQKRDFMQARIERMRAEATEREARATGKNKPGLLDAITKNVISSASRSIGSRLVRGLFGTLFGGKR